MVICVQICRSKFTQKTSTCELCPSPLRTISISIAIGDGTKTRSRGFHAIKNVRVPLVLLQINFKIQHI